MRGLIAGLMRLPGTAERYIDLLTGKEYSRRGRDDFIRRLPEIDRELRLQAALRTQQGSIVRDYIRERGIRQFTVSDAQQIQEIFRLLKTGDRVDKIEALRRIGRIRDAGSEEWRY